MRQRSGRVFSCWSACWSGGRARRDILVLTLALFAALVALHAPRSAAAEEAAPQRAAREGRWIRVPLPVDHATVVRVRQTISRALATMKEARPVFVLEFEAAAENADAGEATRFGDAYELAQYLTSQELNAAITVAYVPRSIKGHAVLVALACEEIVMAPGATMGDAGGGEPAINNTLLAAYREIAQARRRLPSEVALGMLDKSRAVIRAKTETTIEYGTPERIQEIARDHQIVEQEQIKAPDAAWQLSGAEARKFGLIKFVAEDRRDLIRAMELSPRILEGDPSLEGGWRAVRIDFKARVTADKVGAVQRKIEEALNNQVNFICLWIESAGGSPVDSVQLAEYLAGLDRNRVRTAAYIPSEARADATLIAMACDQIILGPDAVLGGPGAYQMNEREIGQYRQTIRDSLAPKKMRSWSVWAAMIDPSVTVFRCTRPGETEYFSEEEMLSLQPKREQGEKGAAWEKQEPITKTNQVLQLSGNEAVEYHAANAMARDFVEFKERFGLENDLTLVADGWVDHLVGFLKSSEIGWLLLVVGLVALYIELHGLGMGIGAFVATVCFAVFFWAKFLDGTAGWLEVTLFVTGVVCLLLEFFVIPGFGIFGLGGGVLVIASLVLASETTLVPRNEYQLAQLERSLVTLLGVIGLLVVAALVARRWLPKNPFLKGVFLAPPEGAEAEVIRRREMLVDLENLVGTVGVTATPLTPGGKARFGNHLVDVMAADFIPRNARIEVIEVHGNRVLVRPAGG